MIKYFLFKTQEESRKFQQLCVALMDLSQMTGISTNTYKVQPIKDGKFVALGQLVAQTEIPQNRDGYTLCGNIVKNNGSQRFILKNKIVEEGLPNFNEIAKRVDVTSDICSICHSPRKTRRTMNLFIANDGSSNMVLIGNECINEFEKEQMKVKRAFRKRRKAYMDSLNHLVTIFKKHESDAKIYIINNAMKERA